MGIESALVTGGGSGIGAALAEALAGRGCRVLISGRRRDALENVANSSDSIVFSVGDITSEAHRADLKKGLANLPAPRALFHGAGYFQTGFLSDLETTDWRRSFETNVEARWALSRELVDLLVGGRVLFVGSDSGANPRLGAAAYSIAQAASETLRRALQAEWSEIGVAVAGFKPGLVDTEMVRDFLELTEKEFPARAAYQEMISNGQLASPEVMARFAAWLLLDVPRNRFMETEWDARSPGHHSEWMDGPLYPNAVPE